LNSYAVYFRNRLRGLGGLSVSNAKHGKFDGRYC
jgi:hypothetical protein